MKEITIDCALISDQAGFHSMLAETLNFPQWYGRNLDALHDLLTAMGDDTALYFAHWALAEQALGRYSLAARKAISHAANRNPHLTVEFL